MSIALTILTTLTSAFCADTEIYNLYKVNFSKYHGLCKDPFIMPFALQACGMCGS